MTQIMEKRDDIIIITLRVISIQAGEEYNIFVIDLVLQSFREHY